MPSACLFAQSKGTICTTRQIVLIIVYANIAIVVISNVAYGCAYIVTTAAD